MASRFEKIKNFITGAPIGVGQSLLGNQNVQGDTKQAGKDMSLLPMPQTIARIRQDVGTWRDNLRYLELPYNPYRYKVQEMYIDTVLNGHVRACMDKRHDLTLLREWCFYDAKENELDDENLEAIFNTRWFESFVRWSLEANAFGYSLISLNDVEDGRFEKISLVNRINISPDRRNVVAFKTAITGYKWDEDPYRLWNIYVDTPTDIGVSRCGYGYLLPVSLLEIFLRNLQAYNGDFAELFAQPYRVGKTNSVNEEEIAQFDQALQNIGSAGWARIGQGDEIQLLESALGGTGYKAYDNFELRLERKISKLILGHEDAMNSTPGKLGGEQGGEGSPIAVALAAKASVDGKMIERIVNEQLIPRMREIGFTIPDGVFFKFKNDREREKVIEKELKTNTAYADLAVKMKNAGFSMSAEYFEEQTGIPTTTIEQIEPDGDEPASDPTPNIANKLKNWYK